MFVLFVSGDREGFFSDSSGAKLSLLLGVRYSLYVKLLNAKTNVFFTNDIYTCTYTIKWFIDSIANKRLEFINSDDVIGEFSHIIWTKCVSPIDHERHCVK